MNENRKFPRMKMRKIVKLPVIEIADLKLRFIMIDREKTFYNTSEIRKRDCQPLFLGSDVLQDVGEWSKNRSRVHARFARQGLATKLEMTDCRIDGLSKGDEAYFYSVYGLFSVVFEYHPIRVQQRCLQHLLDIWMRDEASNRQVHLDAAYSVSEDSLVLTRETTAHSHPPSTHIVLSPRPVSDHLYSTTRSEATRPPDRRKLVPSDDSTLTHPGQSREHVRPSLGVFDLEPMEEAMDHGCASVESCSERTTQETQTDFLSDVAGAWKREAQKVYVCKSCGSSMKEVKEEKSKSFPSCSGPPVRIIPGSEKHLTGFEQRSCSPSAGVRNDNHNENIHIEVLQFGHNRPALSVERGGMNDTTAPIDPVHKTLIRKDAMSADTMPSWSQEMKPAGKGSTSRIAQDYPGVQRDEESDALRSPDSSVLSWRCLHQANVARDHGYHLPEDVCTKSLLPREMENVTTQTDFCDIPSLPFNAQQTASSVDPSADVEMEPDTATQSHFHDRKSFSVAGCILRWTEEVNTYRDSGQSKGRGKKSTLTLKTDTTTSPSSHSSAGSRNVAQQQQDHQVEGVLLVLDFLLRALEYFKPPVRLSTLSELLTLVLSSLENCGDLAPVSEDWQVPCALKFSAMTLLGRWLGEEFCRLEPTVARRVAEFKRRHINNIGELPPACKVLDDLFPPCMVLLASGWIGLTDLQAVEATEMDHSYEDQSNSSGGAVRNNRNLYPVIQLVLELLNNSLVSGIAHVVYCKLRHAS